MRRTVMMLLSLAWLPTWAHAQIAPATPASTKPPVLVAPTPLTLPKITERLLPNGLKLVIVEQHEIPVVDVSLVIRTGAEADPRGSPSDPKRHTLQSRSAVLGDTQGSSAVSCPQALASRAFLAELRMSQAPGEMARAHDTVAWPCSFPRGGAEIQQLAHTGSRSSLRSEACDP